MTAVRHEKAEAASGLAEFLPRAGGVPDERIERECHTASPRTWRATARSKPEAHEADQRVSVQEEKRSGRDRQDNRKHDPIDRLSAFGRDDLDNARKHR